MMKRFILSLAAAASLAACSHGADTYGARTFGQSVATMVAAQSEPTAPSNTPPESSGRVGERAVDAYNNGTPPAPPQTVTLNLNTTSD